MGNDLPSVVLLQPLKPDRRRQHSAAEVILVKCKCSQKIKPRRDLGAPRGGGQWPRDRSVWDTQHDRQDGRGADRQDGRNSRQTGQHGDHQDAGFRERHLPQVGQPPTDVVGLRRELLLQQHQFQEQMMVRMEQMLSRVQGGGGMWPGRVHSNF